MLEGKQYVLLSLFIVYCTGEVLRVYPQNTAAVVNDTVVLQCRGTNDLSTITWAEYVTNEMTETNIYIGDMLQSPPNREIYDVIFDNTKSRSDLSIRPLQTSGGRYRCQDFTITVNGFAHVTILETEPECVTNATSELRVGQVVLMLCTVDYSSKSINWPPSVQFTKNNTVIKHVDESSTRTVVATLYVTTSAALNGAVYNARFYFDHFTENLPADHATNIPSYSYSHQYEPLNVLYSTRYEQLEPVKSEYIVGESITCSADGNPEPSYSWTLLNNTEGYVVVSPIFVLGNFMVGPEMDIQCEACNVIVGVRHCISETITITVKDNNDCIAINNNDCIDTKVAIPIIVIFALASAALGVTTLVFCLKYRKLCRVQNK